MYQLDPRQFFFALHCQSGSVAQTSTCLKSIAQLQLSKTLSPPTEVLLLLQPKPASAVTTQYSQVICGSVSGERCDILSRGQPSFVTHRGFRRIFSIVESLVNSYKFIATMVYLKCHDIFCDLFQFVFS